MSLTIEQAEEITNLQHDIDYLSQQLVQYDKGKSWSISLIGDSRHFDAKRMVQTLPKEDREAINKYIVGKFRKRIRDAKAKMKEYGVDPKVTKYKKRYL